MSKSDAMQKCPLVQNKHPVLKIIYLLTNFLNLKKLLKNYPFSNTLVEL